jgi:hypothetical protein
VATDVDLRPLPDAIAQSRCEGCGDDVVWAMTVAGPNGPGGKYMPLNPYEDLAGNVAVTAPHRGRLLARVLTKGETFDRPHEYAGMTHFATCVARIKPALPPEVIDLAAERQQRRGRRTTRRRR